MLTSERQTMNELARLAIDATAALIAGNISPPFQSTASMVVYSGVSRARPEFSKT